MDARRSFYFAPGQDDLAEAALDANCLDWDDIPFVAPANGPRVPDKNHPGMWRSVKSTEREFWKGRTAVNYWMSTAKLP